MIFSYLRFVFTMFFATVIVDFKVSVITKFHNCQRSHIAEFLMFLIFVFSFSDDFVSQCFHVRDEAGEGVEELGWE